MWSKEEIGQVIKESRLSAGLTQVQVAEILGRPQNTISAWEMGRAQPDANTLFELFQALGRSVDEAFGFSPLNKNAPPYSSEALKLAKDYDVLDDYGKRMVRLVADAELERYTNQAEQKKLFGVAIADQEPSTDSEVASTETAEALYRSSSGYVPKADASALTTTEDTEPNQGEKMA